MISDRLYIITDYICRAGLLCGSFEIRLDSKNRVLLHCNYPKVKIMCWISNFLTRLWALTAVGITTKAFLDGDVNQFVVKLLFIICGAIVIIIKSIATSHVDDIVLLVNMALGLLHDTQGSFLKI